MGAFTYHVAAPVTRNPAFGTDAATSPGRAGSVSARR